MARKKKRVPTGEIFGKIAKKWKNQAGIGETDFGKLVKYLEFFGYLSPGAATAAAVLKAVKSLQRDAGLSQDSVAGEKTLRTLQLPRCGVREQMRSSYGKWGIRDLNYFVEAYVPGIPNGAQDSIFRSSYNGWESKCNLRFHQTLSRNEAHIVISVSKSARLGFGRRGGTLASAQLPPTKNWQETLLLDFDGAELWREDEDFAGTLLENVHSHETGHNIGLGHDNSGETALMNPFYNAAVKGPLPPDIKRAVSLYGKPSSPPTTTPSSPTYEVRGQNTIVLHGHTLSKKG